MTITLLGTGTSTGVPMIGCDCAVCRSVDFRDKRLRTSVHIAVGGQSLVIDTGPDFRQQMLRLAPPRLDAVLFTHEHKDHTAGLDDIRAFNYRQQGDIPVYARASVLEQLRREFAYVFAERKYPGIPQVQIHEITDNPFIINSVEIIPINVLHHRLPVFGFRIGDFTYLTDLNHISESEMDKVRGSKVLVLDALQRSEHTAHYTLPQAVAVAEQIGADRTYFTHISHRMGLHHDVERELPPHIRLGYDGMEIMMNDE
jgi:phosphoribosyl 1,2-cyclic phosphate phosphodiesterase